MMKTFRRYAWVVLLVALLIPAGQCLAALDVWVDFNPSWATELDDAATAAGVAAFTAGEQATIEADILTELNRIYAAYDVTFVTGADPGGTRDWIDMGATTGTAGLLGSAPLLFGVGFTHDEISPTSKANIYVENFAFIIESGDARATQMTEMSIALAGTAAHELGHSLGLEHHHAYGNAGIHPGIYGATGGLQNTAIMATGSTGLDEAGRESMRDFGLWEQALLDISGGSGFTTIGGTGTSIVTAPVTTEFEGAAFSTATFDAGMTAGTAMALTPQLGETSGLLMGFVTGTLTGPADEDWFSLTLPGAGTLTLDLWSAGAYSIAFNTLAELVGPDGISVLIGNDNAVYSGNTYGAGGFGSTDSFLPNVPIAVGGTYYFRVKTFPGTPPADPGDYYSLIVGFDALDTAGVPEPSVVALLVTGAFVLTRRRGRS